MKNPSIKLPCEDSAEAREAYRRLEAAAAKHESFAGMSRGDEHLFGYLTGVERDVEMLEAAISDFRSAFSTKVPESVVDLARARLRRSLHRLAWTSAWIFDNMDESGVFKKPRGEG